MSTGGAVEGDIHSSQWIARVDLCGHRGEQRFGQLLSRYLAAIATRSEDAAPRQRCTGARYIPAPGNLREVEAVGQAKLHLAIPCRQPVDLFGSLHARRDRQAAQPRAEGLLA